MTTQALTAASFEQTVLNNDIVGDPSVGFVVPYYLHVGELPPRDGWYFHALLLGSS